MKTQFYRRPNGFTLVELLVVIAIIAVLAGAGFAAGNAAIQKAKKTTATATCIALESAVNNFYTEYGAMPTNDSGDSVLIDTKDGSNPTLRALLGIEGSGANVLNPRNIKFLSLKEGKKTASGGINGIIFSTNGQSIEGIFDPWGGSYKMVIDGDYNEQVRPSPKGGGTTVTLNGRRAAAWSDGADGSDAASGKIGDDVITWNK